jgi:purine catabolism regulator
MVTVGDLLADDALGLVPTHVPEPDAEVRWVAPSELADPTPFLEGGEVLLTTGLETVGWRSEWQAYADRLVAARVVAVGFATGLSHRRLPRGLVRACESVGLNVFEVPRRTTFVAISRAIARMIDVGAEAEARRSLQVQRELTQAALRPREPAVLVGRLAEVVDGAAAVLGRDGQVELGPLGPRADDLNLALVGAEVARIRPQALRAASTVQTAGETVVVQPVGLSGRPSSYLAVLVPGRAGDMARSAVATAVSLLGLAAESDRTGRRAARRLRARALELLVEADAGTAAVVLSAGSGREVSLPDRVAVVRAAGPGEALDDALGVVEDVVALAGRIGDELWLVATPGDAGRQADQLGERGLLVGVGDPAAIDEAARSHANAGQALRAATPAVPVVRWKRLMREGAMGVLDDERAAAFAASYLAPIANDPELIRTLQSFLGHHGSRLKVADELGVHRNTVRNRLEQVEVALDGSLDDPQLRVNAWIALQVVARRRPM